MFRDSSGTNSNRVPQKIAVLVIMVFAHFGHAAESIPQQLSEQEEQAALLKAEAVGLAIYKHDHAAAVATDAIAGIGVFKTDKRLRGWITESQGDGILVTFIGGDANQAAEALYRVSVSTEGEVSGPPQELKVPEALTEWESAAAAARGLALKHPFQSCAERYNTVVLPADSLPSPNWVVYLLPGTKDASHVPLGGAHRLEIEATGQHLISERAFTHSCVVLGDSKADPKHRPVMLVATHVMDPVPTEIHVFWNLWVGIPLDILTIPNGTIWNISKGHISLVQRKAAK
jgi:hypothetical protein